VVVAAVVQVEEALVVVEAQATLAHTHLLVVVVAQIGTVAANLAEQVAVAHNQETPQAMAILQQ
jgi:hypothetical protein